MVPSSWQTMTTPARIFGRTYGRSCSTNSRNSGGLFISKSCVRRPRTFVERQIAGSREAVRTQQDEGGDPSPQVESHEASRCCSAVAVAR